MLWRKWARDIAKVGAEGSNPFARSSFSCKVRAFREGRHDEPFAFSSLSNFRQLVRKRPGSALRFEQPMDDRCSR